MSTSARAFHRQAAVTLSILVALLLSAGAIAAEDRPCASCHAEIEKPAKSVHAALGMGCDSCHQIVAGKTHPAEKKSIALTANGAALCFTCHEEAKFKAKVVHGPVAEGSCLLCHSPHTSANAALLSAPVPELCVACHADKTLDEKAVVQHAPFAMGDCLVCHMPHAGDTPGLLKIAIANPVAPVAKDQAKSEPVAKDQAKSEPVAKDQAKSEPAAKDPAKPATPANPVSPVNGLCFTCHEEEGYATHPVARHPTSGKEDVSRPGKELSCVSCHDPHQSKHKRLFYKSDSTMAMCVECHGKGKKPIR